MLITLIYMKRKFHYFLTLLTSTEKLLTRAGFEFAPSETQFTVSESIAELVERRTIYYKSVPEGRHEFKSHSSQRFFC